MGTKKNYYQILGLNTDCSQDDIKKVYRKLAAKYHPDVKGGDGDYFKEINEAYHVLIDPQKRKQYDVINGSNRNFNFEDFSGYQGFTTFDDFFSQFFGGKENYRTYYKKDKDGSYWNWSKPNQEILDITVEVKVDLEKIYNNEKIIVNYNRKIPCVSCDGTGKEVNENYKKCPFCDGSGENLETGYKCNQCNDGKIYQDPCSVCKGSKMVEKEEKIHISNLYRLNGQQKIDYKGYGNYSSEFENYAGDMTVVLSEYNNKSFYWRESNELHIILNLDFSKAILGGDYKLNLLGDNTISIKIPQYVEDGKKLRIKDKGFLNQDGINRGDLIVHINIIIDYENLPKELEEWLKKNLKN